MVKTEVITNDTPRDKLSRMVHLQRAFIMPYSVNNDVWIIIKGKPTKVIVTDIAVRSIQLNGRWYTWEEVEAEHGGVFESEFEALTSMAK